MSDEYKLYLSQHKKTVAMWGSLIVGIVAIVVGLIIYDYYQARVGKIAVEVLTAPQDATVKLSDGTVLGRGTVWVRPGTYTATVNKSGFTTRTKNLIVQPYINPTIYIGLAPESQEAWQWYHKQQSLYAELEAKSRDAAIISGEKFTNANPIVKKLPIEDPYFSIRYETKNDKDITLVIRGTSPRYREYAIQKIYELGYDPADYQLDIKGFVNPLGVTP
jgi:hypothetical protein